MYIATEVSHKTSEKLNKASTKARMYPFDDKVIDWSVPIDDEHLYLPEAHCFFYGSEFWDGLEQKDKSFLSRWQFTQMMRNAGLGEHLLNQGLFSILHHTPQYDPAWRFMLHEVAEECQHMAMFNNWVRLNSEFRTFGLGGEHWGLPVSMIIPFIATKFTVLFWTGVMLFEVIGEEVLNAAAKDKSGTIHPIVQNMAKAHKIEEARHIYFAKEWINTRWPKLNRVYKLLVSRFSERVLGAALRTGIPIIHNEDIAHLISKEDFASLYQTKQRRRLINLQFSPTIYEMNEMGIIRDKTLAKWEGQDLISNDMDNSRMAIA